ncbi:MAG: thioredoxin [Thermodesulfobacteriota bacterium]|nr:thioredoxin [Thermodesulfobacteriota bacterium]
MADKSFVDNPNVVLDLNSGNFDEAVSKYDFLVVDCWAEWCGPCKMVGPVVASLAEKKQGEIVFGKLDVDSNRELAMKFGIRSIPDLLVFKDHKKVGDVIGAMPEAMLLSEIERYK